MSEHAYGGGFAGQDRRPSEEIRVPRGKCGPGLGHVPLVASDGVITVGEQGFRLADVDRVSYHAAVQTNLAHYRIGVGQGSARRTFTFDAYRRGTELDDKSRHSDDRGLRCQTCIHARFAPQPAITADPRGTPGRASQAVPTGRGRAHTPWS
jgi:hypothetical protein